MGILRCQYEFRHVSGLPEDSATMTLHVGNGGVGDPYSDVAAVMFNLIEGGTGYDGLGALISNSHSSGDLVVRVYDRADPEPRAPRATIEGTFDPASSEGMPPQVALCVSFEGSRVSGEPQSRRRGRFYLPWIEQTANVDGRPSETYLEGIKDTIAPWGGELLDLDEYQVGVWSTVDEQFVPAVRFYIDNSWDIQRRRGLRPTLRVSLP